MNRYVLSNYDSLDAYWDATASDEDWLRQFFIALRIMTYRPDFYNQIKNIQITEE
jgi:hypothetical protein